MYTTYNVLYVFFKIKFLKEHWRTDPHRREATLMLEM